MNSSSQTVKLSLQAVRAPLKNQVGIETMVIENHVFVAVGEELNKRLQTF